MHVANAPAMLLSIAFPKMLNAFWPHISTVLHYFSSLQDILVVCTCTNLEKKHKNVHCLLANFSMKTRNWELHDMLMPEVMLFFLLCNTRTYEIPASLHDPGQRRVRVQGWDRLSASS